MILILFLKSRIEKSQNVILLKLLKLKLIKRSSNDLKTATLFPFCPLIQAQYPSLFSIKRGE